MILDALFAPALFADLVPRCAALWLAAAGEVGTIGDTPISEERFAQFVLAEQGRSGSAAEALDHLIQERLVAIEAHRRGIIVTEADIEARIAALDQGLRDHSRGASGIEEQLAAMKIDLATFRTLLRKSIAAERMMCVDYGLKSGSEVPPEKQSLWFQELKSREAVHLDGLPEGVAATIGEERIAATDWGLELFRSLKEADGNQLFEEFVGIQLLLAEGKARGLTVTSEHIAHEVQERSAQLVAKLRAEGMATEGVDYLGTLEARGDDPKQVVASDRFRAAILLKELARQRYGADGWRHYYDDHRADFDRAFGRRVHIATLFLRASQQKSAKIPRTWESATDELDQMKRRALTGDAPLTEAFATLARLRSEHASASRGGDLGFLSAPQLEQLHLSTSALDEKGGALLGPLVTPEGVHLLLVLEQRAASPFEEIVTEVEQAARRELIQQLRAAVKVERKI